MKDVIEAKSSLEPSKRGSKVKETASYNANSLRRIDGSREGVPEIGSFTKYGSCFVITSETFPGLQGERRILRTGLTPSAALNISMYTGAKNTDMMSAPRPALAGACR